MIMTLQNTTDFMSINEALLVRFRTDDTIANKGFVAIFVAVDRQESEENLGGEEDEDSGNLWSLAQPANQLGIWNDYRNMLRYMCFLSSFKQAI